MIPERLPDPATRIALAILAAVYAVSYTVGPAEWHRSSFFPILHAAKIPLSVYGWALWVAVVLILMPRYPWVRFYGYLIGAVVFTTFTLVLVFQSHFVTKGASPTGVAVLGFAAAIYWISAYRSSRLAARV